MLQAIPFFGALSGPALQPLLACGRWHVYRRGETIVESEDGKGYAFVVTAGQVQVQVVSPMGERYPVLLLGPGDIIDPATLPTASLLALRAEADDDGALALRFNRPAFEQAVLSESASARVLIEQVEVHLGEVIGSLADFAFCDGLRRLAHVLGRLALRDEAHTVNATHDELGRMAGMGRARVTELLKRLASRKLIICTAHRHGIKVPDPERLASLLT